MLLSFRLMQVLLICRSYASPQQFALTTSDCIIISILMAVPTRVDLPSDGRPRTRASILFLLQILPEYMLGTLPNPTPPSTCPEAVTETVSAISRPRPRRAATCLCSCQKLVLVDRPPGTNHLTDQTPHSILLLLL